MHSISEVGSPRGRALGNAAAAGAAQGWPGRVGCARDAVTRGSLEQSHDCWSSLSSRLGASEASSSPHIALWLSLSQQNTCRRAVRMSSWGVEGRRFKPPSEDFVLLPHCLGVCASRYTYLHSAGPHTVALANFGGGTGLLHVFHQKMVALRSCYDFVTTFPTQKANRS